MSVLYIPNEKLIGREEVAKNQKMCYAVKVRIKRRNE